MNEFTKEEPKHLFNELTCLTELYEEPEIMYTIKDKLEFLVNNYDAEVIKVWHCEKCGHVQ